MIHVCRHCNKEFNDVDAPSEGLYHESTETGLCFVCLDDISSEEIWDWDDDILAAQELEDFSEWESYVIDGEDYPF